MPGFQNSKNGKKHNFLLLEHFQKVESKSGLAGSVLGRTIFRTQDRIKVDTDSESLKDSNMCSQFKIYSKSASLWVKNAVEVDRIKIESKLRAH